MSASDADASVSELLGFAHELADQADAITLRAFRGQLDVRTKADGTWVTAADEEVERTLREHILRRFPGHAILGEEDGRQGDLDAPVWVIDPIDGTTNFVRGNPIFATLIALQVEGDEQVGVVSAPALGTRWDGVRDGPAHQDGRRLEVSGHTALAESEVAFGGLDYFDPKGLAELIPRLSRLTRRQRGYGDFWQHCLVASGSTDIAIEAEVNLWDLAAVKVVVEAAGGRFTSLDGRRTADGGDALSTNGHLHDPVLELIAELREIA